MQDETENKKTAGANYKRKRITQGGVTSKKDQLTKKRLEEFNNATTRDYLSDDGEEALDGLLNIIARARAQVQPQKRVGAITKGGKRGQALGNKQF